ncbi:metal ABC transporter ATP-binding protein [Sodalis ligni]|uniref:metal ABC transporter ATP-binding protein n=1 Tax=Sodalis ligni TaxID=2697027 RepID=UPI001BDE1B39|nr:metal ABC transporter ATP-binding protein [Sodalis ligni]QWA12800.1 metal ABC transporter ATP-binding protein [Sodalis ligni]
MAGKEGELLVVNNASVSFFGRTVLQQVCFSLKAGEFCGLIGANGSGKTTLLRTILGFQALNQGSIIINDASGRSGHTSVGYVPQKILFDPEVPLRARDLIALGLDGHRLGFPFSSKEHSNKVDEMLNAVGAASFADKRVGSLSGGQQQRVLIAHALIRQPRLLLLDEPLANLDMGSVAEIVSLLRRLSVEHNVTLLLSAHDMNPLLSVMDRIVYLANGRAVSGNTEDVVRTEVLSKLYGYHIDVIRVSGRILVIAATAVTDGQRTVESNLIHNPGII